MLIRTATPADIPSMMQIRLAVRENVLSNPDLVTEADCLEFINRRGKGWVCETEEGIAGFAIADLQDDNIWALFIAPEYEGRSIGRKLHDTMLGWYFEQGKEQVWLGTAPGTRAADFYRKAGWRESGLHGNNEIKFEMTRERWLGNRS
ncbi:MAG: GNAT family N-acetyltransferase [Saprospiraceae bacterium]|nr:GNAT family N-acetyltransferase [Saprospiraceae bacterium]